MKFYSLLFAILSMSIIFYSCIDDDEVSMPVVCENGFISDGDSCECPEENVTAYDNCVELSDNQYYGITNGCPCVDTLIWTLNEKDELNYRTATINNNLSITNADGNRLRQNVIFYTVETSTGDSLYVATNNGIEVSGAIMACNAVTDDDLYEGVHFNALLSPDEKTISATLTYHDNVEGNTIVGTCAVDFVKK